MDASPPTSATPAGGGADAWLAWMGRRVRSATMGEASERMTCATVVVA